eukprot:COSAG06_NODE_18812_length_867_cov_1.406250_1_plen_134_part_00
MARDDSDDGTVTPRSLSEEALILHGDGRCAARSLVCLLHATSIIVERSAVCLSASVALCCGQTCCVPLTDERLWLSVCVVVTIRSTELELVDEISTQQQGGGGGGGGSQLHEEDYLPPALESTAPPAAEITAL